LRNEFVEELIPEPTNESRAELDVRVKREQKERDGERKGQKMRRDPGKAGKKAKRLSSERHACPQAE
jgi:hypothetical protein